MEKSAFVPVLSLVYHYTKIAWSRRRLFARVHKRETRNHTAREGERMKKKIGYRAIVFVASALTMLGAICSVLFLQRAESAVRTLPQSEHLAIEGTYYTLLDETPRPLPEDGRLVTESKGDGVVIEGRFARAVPENEILSLRLDNMYLRFFVDGALLYEYGAPGSVLPYVRSSGNGWQYVRSPGIAAESTVRIELQNQYDNHPQAAYAAFLNELSVGNPVWRISEDLRAWDMKALVALLIMFIGFFELGYGVALALAKENGNAYFALAGLCICSGIWCLMNFRVLALFLPYPIANNAIEQLSLCMTICYMLLFMATQLTGVRRRCIRVSACAMLCLTAASIVTQHLGIYDYYDYAILLYGVVAVASVEILIMLVLEYRLCHTARERRRFYPPFFLLAGVFGEAIATFLGILPFVVFEGTLLLFSLWQMYLVWNSVNSSASSQARMRMLQADHERQQRLLEYQILLSQSTKGLYESIYEIDITHNCAGGESTGKYFESLGVPADATFDEALQCSAEKNVHPDFRRAYIDTFCTEAVLTQYARGVETLEYEFLIAKDGGQYYWMRIDARIFFWNDDKSVRMIIYRQSIDEEKRRERHLQDRAELDPLTGLYNRAETRARAEALLSEPTGMQLTCCIMMDIDDFKNINDSYGHMAGDDALIAFSRLLRTKFRPNDVVGRLGGDEFIVFAEVPSDTVVRTRVREFLEELKALDVRFEGQPLPLATSIGIAIEKRSGASFEQLYKHADDALYSAKNAGKNRYMVFAEE